MFADWFLPFWEDYDPFGSDADDGESALRAPGPRKATSLRPEEEGQPRSDSFHLEQCLQVAAVPPGGDGNLRRCPYWLPWRS